MANTDSSDAVSDETLSKIILGIAFLIFGSLVLQAFITNLFHLFGDPASPEDIHNFWMGVSRAAAVWAAGSVLAWWIRDKTGLVLGLVILPLAVGAWVVGANSYRGVVDDLADEHGAVTELLGQLQLPSSIEIQDRVDEPVDLKDGRSRVGAAGLTFRFGVFGDREGLDAAISALPATLVASQCDQHDEWYEYELAEGRRLVLTLKGYPADQGLADLRIVYSRDLNRAPSSSADKTAHCPIIVPQD